jgi:hypothetical protein
VNCAAILPRGGSASVRTGFAPGALLIYAVPLFEFAGLSVFRHLAEALGFGFDALSNAHASSAERAKKMRLKDKYKGCSGSDRRSDRDPKLRRRGEIGLMIGDGLPNSNRLSATDYRWKRCPRTALDGK